MDTLPFKEIIYRFRKTKRVQANRERMEKAQHRAFATFQGKNPNGTLKVYTCICNGKHRYADCYYLIPIARPKDWIPNPTEVKRINDEMAKMPPRKKAQIRRAQDYAASNKGTNQAEAKPNSDDNNDLSKEPLLAIMMAGLGAFVSRDIAYPKYELHSSVILDSGATLHIGNDKARFLGLTLANRDEFLYAREDYILIVAYGIMELTVQTHGYPEGRKIKLTKAAYILTFYTSIVLLQLLNKYQVYWNNRTTSLEFGIDKLHFADTLITYS